MTHKNFVLGVVNNLHSESVHLGPNLFFFEVDSFVAICPEIFLVFVDAQLLPAQEPLAADTAAIDAICVELFMIFQAIFGNYLLALLNS